LTFPLLQISSISIPAQAAQNPRACSGDDVVLHFLEAARVPVTAQLTAAAVQCKYEQLDVRPLPAAFAANMH
jgi:hypothetical protein